MNDRQRQQLLSHLESHEMASAIDNTRHSAVWDDAYQLLLQAACLMPQEPIPTALLYQSMGMPDPNSWQAAMALLTEIKLLEIDDETIIKQSDQARKHVLAVADEQIQLNAQKAVEIALCSGENRFDDLDEPRPNYIHTPHLAYAAIAAEPRGDLQSGQLLNELGVQKYSQGKYAEAAESFEKALHLSLIHI